MKHFTVKLKEQFPGLVTEQEPRLVAYIPDNLHEIDLERRHPAILICPGGAYMGCSDREAEPIALDYNARGFAAFVLYYSCRPAVFPQSLREAGAAMALIRRNADDWKIDTERIAVCGFSAGGHLAASLGTKWHRDELFAGLGLTHDEPKPNAQILCYPVMAGDDLDGEPTSIHCLTGHNEPTPDEFAEHDLPSQVTSLTPPAFLWHTENDPIVPVTGTLRFVIALHRCGVSSELHVFPFGAHGLANANTTACKKDNPWNIVPQCETWVPLSIRWLLETFSGGALS